MEVLAAAARILANPLPQRWTLQAAAFGSFALMEESLRRRQDVVTAVRDGLDSVRGPGAGVLDTFDRWRTLAPAAPTIGIVVAVVAGVLFILGGLKEGGFGCGRGTCIATCLLVPASALLGPASVWWTVATGAAAFVLVAVIFPYLKQQQLAHVSGVSVLDPLGACQHLTEFSVRAIGSILLFPLCYLAHLSEASFVRETPAWRAPVGAAAGISNNQDTVPPNDLKHHGEFHNQGL